MSSQWTWRQNDGKPERRRVLQNEQELALTIIKKGGNDNLEHGAANQGRIRAPQRTFAMRNPHRCLDLALQKMALWELYSCQNICIAGDRNIISHSEAAKSALWSPLVALSLYISAEKPRDSAQPRKPHTGTSLLDHSHYGYAREVNKFLA